MTAGSEESPGPRIVEEFAGSAAPDRSTNPPSDVASDAIDIRLETSLRTLISETERAEDE